MNTDSLLKWRALVWAAAFWALLAASGAALAAAWMLHPHGTALLGLAAGGLVLLWGAAAANRRAFAGEVARIVQQSTPIGQVESGPDGHRVVPACGCEPWAVASTDEGHRWLVAHARQHGQDVAYCLSVTIEPDGGAR